MNNDQKLFQKIQNGDKKSFEQLFRTYYAPLCHFAQKYLTDADESEEIVQAFFLKLWENRKKTNINTSLKSYLFSAVKNRCFNYLKHQKIKQDYQSEILNSSDDELQTRHDFVEIDLIEKIERYIEELPERRREIFILSREQGLKYREIAEKLDISIKTVEAQMGHALKELREKLKDYQQLLISMLFFFRK